MKKYLIFVGPYGEVRKTKKGAPLFPFEIDCILNYETENKLFVSEVDSSHLLCIRLKNSGKWQKFPINKIPETNDYITGFSFSKKWHCFFDVKIKSDNTGGILIQEIKIEQG